MKEQEDSAGLTIAVVTDRGLSKKRPLNEDSFLSDPQRNIFAVADGVGGAQAGEVASQTAMEVLAEAFRHHEDGADIEDLMEVAIQRANSSIYRMSREHPKLSMMATTVVALHLDGRTATIGHVGDSRLYRLAPDGKLHRETTDHSVVEEEVQAGRMTPEQASNHPSRNVISRALGAEESVDVDMKTIEVDDSTVFLLCSDGITRHLSDEEIRELLSSNPNLEEVVAELKRRCYERGAEDNLTAVIVRLGEPAATEKLDERTTGFESPIWAEPKVSDRHADELALHETVDALPVASAEQPPDAGPPVEPLAAAQRARAGRRSPFRAAMRALVVLIFVGIVAAASFYGGRYYQRVMTGASEGNEPVMPPATNSPVAPKDPKFEIMRQNIDTDHAKWLNGPMREELKRQNIETPTESSDPQFLYFYGRAKMLEGNIDEAIRAFDLALAKLPESQLKEDIPLAVETRVAIAAATLKSKNRTASAETKAREALDQVIHAPGPSRR